MPLPTALLGLAGLALLVLGGELLVLGASRVAGAAGLSPLVIGLTAVAFGTSAPELAVSTQAALAGQADLATGVGEVVRFPRLRDVDSPSRAESHGGPGSSTRGRPRW